MNAERMHVAGLNSSDAPRYRALMLHAYAAAADAFTSTAEERAAEPESFWVSRIADPKGRSQAFGAFVDDELVGTVTIEYASKPKTRHKAHLIGMFVKESARGLGVGKALVNVALAAAAARPGIQVVTLSLTEGNAPAISLYESCGFKVFGVEPMAIATPEGLKSKVHMWLSLLETTAPSRDKAYRSVAMSKKLRHPDEELEIRAIRAEEIEEARGLLTQEPGWASRFQDPDEFRRLISKSQRALVAIQSGRIAGFVRAITDDMSNGYLTLLIVQSHCRGKGIGRALVRAVMGENTAMTWVLRADRGAEAFYERIGFVRSKVAMERPRAKAPDT